MGGENSSELPASDQLRDLSEKQQLEIINQIEDGTLPTDSVVNARFSLSVELKAIKTGRLYFRNCEFLDGLTVNAEEIAASRIIFSSCKCLDANVTLEFCSLKDLRFTECNFNALFLSEIDSCDKLSIVGSTIKYVSVHKAFIIESEIIGLSSQETVIHDLTATNFRVTNSGSLEILYVVGSFFSDNVVILSQSAKPTIYHFVRCVIGLFKPTGIFSGEFELLEMRVKECFIARFSNRGQMRVSFLGMNEQWKLTLLHSNLGNAELASIPFNRLSAVNFEGSNITDLRYYNVGWCDRKQTTILPEHNRELFRQLKILAGRSEDVPTKLAFKSAEMAVYRAALKLEKSKWWDKKILWLNAISNNHGLSWGRALIGVLVISTGGFVINKWLLGFTTIDRSMFWMEFGEWAELFNPVRKFADSYGLSVEHSGDWKYYVAKIIDIVILRVVLGIWIYQMVKAFRKYSD